MFTQFKNKYSLLSLLLCGVFLLTACGGNKLSVNTEYKQVNFDAFKTYRWYKTSGFDKKGPVSEITYDGIKQAVDDELKAKKFSKTPEGEVDFYVNVTVTAEMRVDINNYQVYSGVGQGYNFNRDTGFQSTLTTEQQTDYIYYRDGTLLIDIIDPSTDKLIWRSVANQRLPKEKISSQEKREKLIGKAVSAALADYPPSIKEY